MRLEQLDPGDASLNPTMLLLLNKREASTVRAMLRIAENLIGYGYPGADELSFDLRELHDSCAAYLDPDEWTVDNSTR